MRGTVSLILSFLLAAAAAGSANALSCHGTGQPKEVAELLFGRDIGARPGFSEAAWARFLAREITPRFPDGLTVTDAVGQWRDPATQRIVQERSKRVEIVLPGHADDQSRLNDIGQTYKREFRQHSVGIIIREACVSF